MQTARIKYLLDSRIEGSLSAAESVELAELLSGEQAVDAIAALMEAESVYPVDTPEQVADRSFEKIVSVDRPVRVRAIRHRLLRLTAAAAVILALGAGIALLLRRPAVKLVVAAEIRPGYSKAVLTLADGTTTQLDSAGSRVIQQGATSVTQQGGHLHYETKNGEGQHGYNTLTTPRGGQFQVSLPDGTNVWLNAESSVRYPVAFTGEDRTVAITGEVYFEVAPDAQRPFHVQISEQTTIDVLGTEFNVSAYPNEPVIRTTLITGSVRVSRGDARKVLQPGWQAQVGAAGQLVIIKDADTEKVTAWKNGFFNFDDVSLEEAMRQLSRWYDIEVVYEKGVPDIYFTGEMSRDVSLPGLLKGLQNTNIHYRIDGRRLIITP